VAHQILDLSRLRDLEVRLVVDEDPVWTVPFEEFVEVLLILTSEYFLGVVFTNSEHVGDDSGHPFGP